MHQERLEQVIQVIERLSARVCNTPILRKGPEGGPMLDVGLLEHYL
jgi:hypothetical protein